jgi:hypothetical protein
MERDRSRSNRTMEQEGERWEEYREITEKVIDAVLELSFIKDYDIKVGYVKSYDEKTSKGKITDASSQSCGISIHE